MPQRTLLEATDPYLYDAEVRSAIGGTVAGRVVTTDATPTTLLTIHLLADRTTLVRARVLARRTGGTAGADGDSAAYILFGAYKMVAGVASVVGGSGPFSNTVTEDQAGWAATTVLNGNTVTVEVTGAADNTITWVGLAHTETV